MAVLKEYLNYYLQHPNNYWKERKSQLIEIIINFLKKKEAEQTNVGSNTKADVAGGTDPIGDSESPWVIVIPLEATATPPQAIATLLQATATPLQATTTLPEATTTPTQVIATFPQAATTPLQVAMICIQQYQHPHRRQ